MAQKFRVLFLGVCLVIGTLGFMGCDHEGGEEFSLIGTWASEYGDSYTITAGTLSYDPGYEGDAGYAGTIVYHSRFTSNAGIIIIEYTKAPKYHDYNESYEITATYDAPGSFQGIYYKDLTSSSVSMAGALDLETYLGAETTTLEEAKSAFTAGNEGNYIYSYSACAKQ